MTLNKLLEKEKILFLLITLLNTIPIFSTYFFSTYDGPAHLYNSQLILYLIKGNAKDLNDFFVFNETVVPNIMGHLLLVVFSFLLSPILAEKILLMSYLIGLPLSFRYFISSISNSHLLLTYLIFSFTYSFLFFMGFYNFCISLIFFFLTLGYWINNQNKISKIKFVLLSLLMLLTYLSHLFTFILLFLILIINIFYNSFIKNDDIQINKNNFFQLIKNSAQLFFVSIIPIILLINYFYTRQVGTQLNYLSHSQLTEWLKNIRPIIAFSIEEEIVYTKKLFYLFLFLISVVIYRKFDYHFSCFQWSSFKSIIKSIIIDKWLMVLVLIIILYFKLPDSDNHAGYVSMRLGWLLFLFLIVWINTNNLPKWIGLLSILISFYVHFNLNNYYIKVEKQLNDISSQCYEAGQKISKNSIVLPLNYSDHWFVTHFSNYLGISKPSIILENYECDVGYFWLKWNKNLPTLTLDSINVNQLYCINWKKNGSEYKNKINYVFVLGNFDAKNDSCNTVVKKIVSNSYTLIYSSSYCQLYRITKP